MSKPVIFLDRDGTINDDPGYIRSPEQFKLLPFAAEGLRSLQEMGFDLVIITNQSGIGRGYFSTEDLAKVHQRMTELLATEGVEIRAIYFCPHTPDEKCTCRKPLTGLIKQACSEQAIQIHYSWIIGDKIADIDLGINAGIKTIQIMGTYPLHSEAHYQVQNLIEAAEKINLFRP